MFQPVVGFPVQLQVIIVVFRRFSFFQTNVVADIPDIGKNKYFT